MKTSKIEFIRRTAFLVFLLFTYFIAVMNDLGVWGDVLSPLNALAYAVILLLAYKESDRSAKVSIVFLILAVACFAWGIADAIWAILSFSGKDPSSSIALWIIYVLTNLLTLSALYIFIIMHFKKWSFVQIVIDSVTIGSMSMMLFWILFLNEDTSILITLMQSDFTSVFSLITDVFMFIGVVTWFLSVRSGKIPDYIIIVSLGVSLFAFSDILYYYMDFNGLYIPNSMIDFAYILSLFLLALGALWKTYMGNSVYDATTNINAGSRSKWLYLLIYPIIILLVDITGVIDVDQSLKHISFYAVIILIYWSLCKYVQLSIAKEAILKNNNEILEQRVSEQVSELKFLANQDTLTTLFNRRYFMNCLEESIQSLQENEMLALLIVDLDRFKIINDTFGHDVGDLVLINFSYRMMEWNNYGAVLSRLGGDEFAMLFVGKYTRNEIESYCVQIINTCCGPLSAGDNELEISLSLGVALYSPVACDGKTLMKNADIAMYRAKSQGYNKYLFYEPYFAIQTDEKNKIEALLKRADLEKDFELYYQPQFSLPERKLVGAEALIRWKNAERGYIPVDIFIPVAEEIDYIYRLGKWVIRESLRQAVKWNKSLSFHIKVGFNISPKQLENDGFIDVLELLIAESCVDTSWVDAEITESLMLNDSEKINSVFESLKSMGITVSIDDFGSGYSALGYINKYPFDRIKIDKSLIDAVSSYNTSGANVVKAAISMAKAVGIKTIAEGVETQEQLDILTELGCDQVQGFFLGRPVPAKAFEQRLMQHVE